MNISDPYVDPATKPRRSRPAKYYHLTVAVLLLLTGGALLALGLYLQNTASGSVLNLQYKQKDRFRVILHARVGALFLGGALLLVGITALLSLAHHCIGVTFRLFHVAFALLLTAGLAYSCAACAIAASGAHSRELREYVGAAWTVTVVSHPDDVCTIEKQFECRGFADGDCKDCPTGMERECIMRPNCARCGPGKSTAVGCFDKIVESAKKVFLPVSIVSGIMAILLLLDSIATCCL